MNDSSTHLYKLIIILISCLILNTIYFQGFVGSDDNRYIMASYQLLQGKVLVDKGDYYFYVWSAARLGFISFIALLLYIFKLKVLWVTYTFSLLIVALAFAGYLLGKLAHNKLVGLWTALITSTCAGYYLYSGIVLPDILAALLTSVAICICFYVYNLRADTNISYFKTAIQCLLIGICIGVAITVKITSAIFVLPILCVFILNIFLYNPQKWIINIISIVGSATILLVIYNVVVINMDLPTETQLVSQNWDLEVFKKIRPYYFDPYLRVLYIAEKFGRYMPLTSCLFLASALIYPFTPNANRLLTVIFLFSLLYLMFGTTKLDEWFPPPLQIRYFQPIFILNAVMMGHVIAVICGPKNRSKLLFLHKFIKRIIPIIICGCMVAEILYNAPLAGNNGKRKLVNSTIEAYYRSKVSHPKYPIVLSDDLSNRMSALFINDVKWPYLNASMMHFIRDGYPKLPFIFLTRKNRDEIVTSGLDIIDKNIINYELVLLDKVNPMQGLAYDLWQGYLFKGFNTNSYDQNRFGYYSVYIYLICNPSTK